MRDLTNPPPQGAAHQQRPSTQGTGSTTLNNPRKRKLLLPCVLESTAFDSASTSSLCCDDDDDEGGGKKEKALEKSFAEIFCDKIWEQCKLEAVEAECFQARTSETQCCSDRHSPPPSEEVDLLACYSDQLQHEFRAAAARPTPFRRCASTSTIFRKHIFQVSLTLFLRNLRLA